MSAFSDQLLRLREEGNLRSLPEIVHEGKHVLKDGRRMLNLSSNDYLGLASEPEMMRRFMSDAAESCRNGVPEDLLLSSSSSRLLTGVNGNDKCTDFGNRECSDFGNSNAPISVTTIHNFR